MNIVIYARYSSEKQTEQSIEGQLKICYDYAKHNDYTIVAEYVDRALSGKSDNRPQFQKMIEDSNKKYFQGVLVYQLDRFARNRYDSAIYKAKLKKNGVRVLSARENISDDASGILVEGLLESMAEYYSVELAQKVQRGMRINAEKCLSNGGSIPLGFKIFDRKLQINEETAPIVREIFQMYADGYRAIDITEYLNAKHIKTSTGAIFNKGSLNLMLNNKKYIGVYKFGEIEIPDGVPHIVSDELFYRVADIMALNKKAPARAKAKEEYLLTTKLFCGHCKSLMVGVCGTSGTGKIHNYYSCNNARQKACHKKNVKKDYLEDIVVNECRKLLTDENIAKIAAEVIKICESDEGSTNIKRLKKLLTQNDKQKENLLQSLKICDIDSVKNTIFDEMEKMEKEHKSIQKEIAIEEGRNLKLTAPEISFFLSQLKKGDINDPKYRKMLITVFLNAIYLYDDSKITMVFNSCNSPVTIDKILLEEIESHFYQERSNFKTQGPPAGEARQPSRESLIVVRDFCLPADRLQ